jgi:hypothetical protein
MITKLSVFDCKGKRGCFPAGSAMQFAVINTRLKFFLHTGILL